MAAVLLTKRIEFSSSHRYHKPEWDAAKNRSTFGACNNDPGHGHNYMLEVTVSGEVDPRTGMVVNLFDLKRVLLHVLEEFDHKHLNRDLPYFERQIPTSENIARVLWGKLDEQEDIGRLQRIRLYEDEDLSADITAETGLEMASVTKRYAFTAVHDSQRGHTWDLFVSVQGRIHPDTGMVTDIVTLDRLVKDLVLVPFDGQDLRIVLATPSVTGEHIAKVVWDRLATAIPAGTLHLIKLVQTRDLFFEYAG